jgi:hypothetical protein
VSLRIIRVDSRGFVFESAEDCAEFAEGFVEVSAAGSAWSKLVSALPWRPRRSVAGTVRAWLIGSYPQLEDRAPIEVVHEGAFAQVRRAAEAFTAGG